MTSREDYPGGTRYTFDPDFRMPTVTEPPAQPATPAPPKDARQQPWRYVGERGPEPWDPNKTLAENLSYRPPQD